MRKKGKRTLRRNMRNRNHWNKTRAEMGRIMHGNRMRERTKEEGT